MKKEELDVLILQYLHGELESGDAERLQNFLQSDASARQRLLALADEELLFRQGLKSPATKKKSTRRGAIASPPRRGWGKLAAAALILGAAGAAYYYRPVEIVAPAIHPIARVEHLEGKVLLLPENRLLAAAQAILPGHGLTLSGAASRASILYPDGTRVDLGPDTQLRNLEDAGSGKKIFIAQGSFLAVVSKQPEGRPMVIVTPHGEARVLGTKLRLSVDPDEKNGTRLEVEEGRVQLKNLAGKTVEVLSGHFAVAAVGVDLLSKPAPAGPSVTPTKLEVVESGEAPDLRVTVTAPGVYKAVVRQSYGGGISEFYNLASDPEAKVNLAGQSSGLFEIGYHGLNYKRREGADPKTCCLTHQAGETRELCYDGQRHWPFREFMERNIDCAFQVVEKSAARVRVKAVTVMMAAGCPLKLDKDLPVTALYTLYPTGEIVVQVRIRRTGSTPMHWSAEYGPHLFLPGTAGFAWSTSEHGPLPGENMSLKSGALILARSEKAQSSLMMVIPVEEQSMFTRHIRHMGLGVGWDRAGYGSEQLVMQPGYDATWAFKIQLGSTTGNVLPDWKVALDALGHATDYREPGKLSGATLVTDDPGDFNKDGYNESEGCYVLRAVGPVSLTYEKGKGAGFAPAFKVYGWAGGAPVSVRIDGRLVPAAAGLVDGTLIVKVLGSVSSQSVRLQIGP